MQALNIEQTQAALALTQASSQNQPPGAVVVTATPEAATAAPENTVEPSATPQPQIVNSTLCWVGPGNKYEVVSSVSQGQFVQVLGRGSNGGWIIIKNPIYTDPCWVQATDIKLDPGMDVNSLQVFYPPPLPTNTPTATPEPSVTPNGTP